MSELHPHVQVTREGDSWIVEIDDGTQVWIPIATERVRENADSIAMALSDAIRRAERRCRAPFADPPARPTEASHRAREAWEARFKHVRAAHTWAAIANERPERRAVCEILARWMAAYADADAEAERAFRALATRRDR